MLVARLRPGPLTLDRAVAVLLTAGAQLEIWNGSDAAGNQIAGALAALGIMAPVAIRRRYPAIVGTAVPVLAAFDHALWNAQFIGYPIGTLCALYALTVWTPPRRFAVGLAVLVAGLLGSGLVPPGQSLRGPAPFTLAIVVVMLLVRRVVGDRDRRARVAERERDVAAREAVVEERARIARELHDVIAHNVSMMDLQAGAERRVLGGADGSTADVLQIIETIGRSALTEMRRLLGMLRSDAAEPLTPQPELSAFRIIQEALTNALKHAGQAQAEVRVRYRADSLELEIVDDGAEASKSTIGGGQGLVGMRERVSLYGGRLDAGERPGGGFAVRVLLPVR
jgi:signal transduction histidine kinase